MKERKIALVTGGSRGIGAAISRRLAASGCAVAINFLNDHESAAELVQEINSSGGKAIAIQAHIGDSESRADLWRNFDIHFDHLDYFIANAAIGVFKRASQLTLKSLRKVFAVNFESLIDMTNEAINRMPKDLGLDEAGNRGRIVAISSIGAERAIDNYGSVGSSKAAMEAMMRQLAVELGPKGINCNVVRAGLVDTGILDYIEGKDAIIEDTIARTPNGRLITPADVAELVNFIVSPNAAMINGQTIMVDGGFNVGA